MSNIESTAALSILVHGEAVRLNRGKSQGDNYDFKYLTDGKGNILPYVSSQCFKKYWRESLPEPFSPIIRGKNAKGDEINQVYTMGNPIVFIDDDLFGYMKAGANSEQNDILADDNGLSIIEEADSETNILLLGNDDIQDRAAFIKAYKKGNKKQETFFEYLLNQISSDLRQYLNNASKDYPEVLLSALVDAINRAIQEPNSSGFILTGNLKKEVDSGKKSFAKAIRDFIDSEFRDALRPKLPTTKRTSPIRMHALVAFSGIYKAKDFQTFSRDTAYTDKNSVLNPSPIGIYSGWLKTRILIEGKRIGKFYLQENHDMVADQLKDLGENAPIPIEEINPYDRDRKKIQYIKLDDTTREYRMHQAIKSLADIGNRQGPASGALHDGSLRPKGFIGAFMNCADSPFDSIWQATEDGIPNFDWRRLRDIINDWEDLFVSRKIYIGYPIEFTTSSNDFEETLNAALKDIVEMGFTFIVDTPRKALLKMADDVSE